MKVDFSANIQLYRKNTADSAAKSTPAAANRGKTDVAEFSRGSTQSPDKSMVALKSGLLRQISFRSDTERIQELQQRIKNGTYRVSTDELVDAILSAE